MVCGAVLIILGAQYFSKSNIKLFFAGYAIGSITEYVISFLTEVLLNTRWWDYSNNILNLNGRVCLLYSVFWGVLTLVFIKKINPKIENFIDKMEQKVSDKILKRIILSIIIFLAIDCIATCYAQKMFIAKTIVENNIEMENNNEIIKTYEKLNDSKILLEFMDIFCSNKKMIRTFPNIKIEDINHNTIYLDSLFPDIQPYYMKIFDK